MSAPTAGADELFRKGRGLIETQDGVRHLFALEIAETPSARARGLMERKSLPSESGMLLVWEETQEVGIWMKNTYIALDLLYIRNDGVIVQLHENAKPLDLTILPSLEPVRSVLEVPAGTVARLKLATGDHFQLLD